MNGARALERRFSAAICGAIALAGCSSSSGDVGSPAGGVGGGGTTSSASGGTVAQSGGAGAGGANVSSAGGAVGGASGAAAGGSGASTSGGTNGGTASAGNAGTSNAGSAGLSGGGAASTCITAGTELCDDFESGALDSKKWLPPKPNAKTVTVVVDDTKAHSGKYSVHIHGVAGDINNGVIAEQVTFPAKNNSFYARIWAYWYPDLPAMDGGDFHTGFIVGTGKNALGDVQAGMGLIGGARQFLGYSIFFGDPSFEFGPWANTKAAPNVWTCLELFEDGSAPDTEKRKVWVNDVELTELESDSKMAAGTQHTNFAPPKFDTVSVGLWEFHPSPTLTDMWVDDVRVSSQKIGCAD